MYFIAEGSQPASRRSALFRVPPQARSFGRETAGFTFIELLLVMGIILTIAAMALPSLKAAIEQAKVARAVGDINAIEKDIGAYEAANGKLPNTLADVGRGALMDPWRNPYQYLNFSTTKNKGAMRKDRFLVPINTEFDLYSMGADGRSVPPLTASVSQDDVVRASDGSYIGLASNY